MLYLSNNYLDSIELILLDGENIFSLFGNYDYNNLSEMDKKYIKVKNTLEYTSFGGYIFPEDEVLYDKNTKETLEYLKIQNYSNVAGVNFYLMKFGNIDDEEKNILAHELLIELLERNDLKDSDIMQIFNEVINCSIRENFFIAALEKWRDSTDDENIKANILFFKYAYYMKNDNKEMLNKLLLEDDIHNKIMEISNENANLDIESLTNSSIEIDINIENETGYLLDNKNTDEENTTLAAVEENDNIENTTNSSIENEEVVNIENNIISDDIFYKDILNRALVLFYLKDYEKGYDDLMKDWEFIKETNLYLENHTEIDNKIKGSAKKIKTRLLNDNDPIFINLMYQS